ncbi:PREDICTED: lebercilin-like [Poecilia mexicana]|uniref:Lebercilin domain-containing protein n=1 Tax=Poecilia mexicana TaxID=48701 RepID=A0A3B3YYW9_9TELE|nr:PREDICTED: lebercilin-like [Poecilia mexicana]XP_014857341.1 PREDICTED: lebercilin-like [Poecilia mexicana]
MGFSTHYQTDSMEESEKAPEAIEDNRILSRQSRRSTKKESRASSGRRHRMGKSHREDTMVESVDSKSKTTTCRSDPDRDRISDGEGRRSDGSLYSEDYENATQSERSLSPFSQTLTPSPVPQRGLQAKQISRSPPHKLRGVGRWNASRPQRPAGLPITQHNRKGNRSQSKESTLPKDLDLVTKRMLSARLLKINELRNSLAELKQQNDELKKENRTLRQLQVRQEKALQRYDDTESEISQLLARHSNEIHVLRERLRRTQERERTAERRLKESEEQLHRSQAAVVRLKKLVDQQELGTRDELSRSFEEEKTRAQEAQRKVKDLERSIELSNNSFQRQLAAEKKKTINSQEEVKNLQEELDRLTNKLKEKERELDAKNIYSNRLAKPALRKDGESSAKRKLTVLYSTKAVQTEDRTSSQDFPSPPPAINDTNEYGGQSAGEYLSLKDLDRVDKPAESEKVSQKSDEHKTRGRHEEELVREQETQQREGLDQELNVFKEKLSRLKNDIKKEQEGEDSKKSNSLFSQKEDDNYWKRGHVQDEVARWNKESTSSQQATEEARRKKEQLLAKMREIDRQNQAAQDSVFDESPLSESRKINNNIASPHPPEERNRNFSVFNHTESEETGSMLAGDREDGRRRQSAEHGGFTAGRRALRPHTSSDDLAFGRYAPSFGHSASRVSPGFPPAPPSDDKNSALEAIGLFNVGMTVIEKETETKAEKDKKSSLMEQLFGAQTIPAGDSFSASSKMKALNSPPTTNGVRSRRDGLHRFSSGSSTPPPSSGVIDKALNVADSKPAIRAIPSFDDDIEELTL